jgi:pimeloyl-ACP methyl ester carboxylesterase
MDHLDIPRARLVGHDWGLVAGYRACLNWPDRFAQFVALAGIHPWVFDGISWPVITRPWHIYVLAALGRATPQRLAVTDRCLRAWRHRGRFTAHEREIYLAAMRTAAAENATVRFDQNLIRREVPEFVRHYRLLRLRVPTLHLNGDHDPLAEGVSQSYPDYIDDMRLEIVPDCGHFVPEEQPEWLLDRLTTFFGA